MGHVHHTHSRRLAAQQTATAGTSPDNAAQTGVTIDRAGLRWPDEVKITLHYVVTLTAVETLKIKDALVQHDSASNMGGAATLVTLESGTGTVLETGATTAKTNEKEYIVSLAAAQRYVRFNYTLDMSKAGTDTISWSVDGVFSPGRREPLTA